MLVSVFLTLAYWLIKILLSPLLLLPNSTLSASFASAIISANGYFSALNAFVPTTTLVSVVILTVLIEGYIFTLKIINWLSKKVPVVGSK